MKLRNNFQKHFLFDVFLFEDQQCRAGICQNGGRCQQEKKSYSCFCSQGFAGRHCESKAGMCFDKRHAYASHKLAENPAI